MHCKSKQTVCLRRQYLGGKHAPMRGASHCLLSRNSELKPSEKKLAMNGLCHCENHISQGRHLKCDSASPLARHGGLLLLSLS